MPKRTDIKKIMVIGSGPIVIGQGAEFDYAGTQACLALKEEGYEVILVNSNPATNRLQEADNAERKVSITKADEPRRRLQLLPILQERSRSRREKLQRGAAALIQGRDSQMG